MSMRITNTSLYSGMAKTCRKLKSKALDLLPNAEYSSEASINNMKKAGEKISSAEQRLILGVTALMSQPFIDWRNKNVDDETRKVSVARTIAKIVAGTLTGYFIRKGCIKGIKALSQIPSEGVQKIKTIFTPKDIKDNTTDAFAQYRNAMGTVVALVVMMFTNFLIDAPLTKFLTNLFVKKQSDNKVSTPLKTDKPEEKSVNKKALLYGGLATLAGGTGIFIATKGKKGVKFDGTTPLKPLNKFFSDFKTVMYRNYGENPGKMLVHTGVLGWILSSLAQISAVVFNDKISPQQKSFLIPQEAADAAINILSFYAITSSFKHFASKLVSTGKLTTKPIKDAILKLGVRPSEIGKYDFNIDNIPHVKKDYKAFKNGVDVVASTIGSIISCNIVTPILRNQYAAKKQKKAISYMNSETAAKELKAPRGISMDDYQAMVSKKYS